MARKKTKPPAPAEAEYRRLKDKARRMKKSLPQLVAAEEELKQYAANWIAVVRNRITALRTVVRQMEEATRPGTVLHRVLDNVALNNVAVDLAHADDGASDLVVVGHDMPIPNLFVMRDYVCRELFPLAEEGAALFAEGGAK